MVHGIAGSYVVTMQIPAMRTESTRRVVRMSIDLDPDHQALSRCIQMQMRTFERVLIHFSDDPDAPFAMDRLSASDMAAIRQDVIGHGFVVNDAAADHMAMRLVEIISICTLIDGMSEEGIAAMEREIEDGISSEERAHGVTLEGYRALFAWGNSMRGGGLMDEAVSGELFKASAELISTRDGFRKLDVIEHVLSIIDQNEALKAVAMEPEMAYSPC